MKVYMIRHAQSANNLMAASRTFDDYMLERYADPPLTDLGQRQAKILAEYLFSTHPKASTNEPRVTGREITGIFTSPMLRALQTTRPISDALGIQPRVWVDLHEHGGMFDNSGPGGMFVPHHGMTREQFRKHFPDYLLPDEIGEDGWWHREASEDMPDCYARAIRVATKLYEMAAASNADDERILLITHGTFMGALLKALLENIPGNHLYFRHYNTAISRVDFNQSGSIIVRYINRSEHLPLELLT
jgi:broad specificity phosphatase PhoE